MRRSRNALNQRSERPPATGRPNADCGAWQGTRYGASCLACCAALMGLLFVVGVMNVLWVARLAAWVFAEKTFAWGGRLAAAGGILLIAWGAAAVTGALR